MRRSVFLCNRSTTSTYRNSALLRCRQCSIVLRLPRPTSADLRALYEESWTEPEVNSAETGAMSSPLATALVDELERTLHKREGRSVSGARILEFGAGSGKMAQALSQRGAEVRTVEPFGHERLLKMGFDNVRKLSDLPQRLRFDGISSFDVVEHLIEPWVELSDLKTRLVPGGWLLVSTPNLRGLNAMLTGSKWREFNKAGHITMFSPKGLIGMLENSGFSDVQQVDWRIDYGRGPHKRIVGRALQLMKLEGALRVLAIAA